MLNIWVGGAVDKWEEERVHGWVKGQMLEWVRGQVDGPVSMWMAI
jgi:hypothetical protein